MSGRPGSPDTNIRVITCKSHTDTRGRNSPAHTGPGLRSPSLCLHVHRTSTHLEAQRSDCGVRDPQPQGSVAQSGRLFGTPWTVARQAPLSTESPSQEYWSGLPFPSPGDLPDPGINPGSPALQADSLPSESLGKPFKPPSYPQIVHTSFCVKSGSRCPGPAATPFKER